MKHDPSCPIKSCHIDDMEYSEEWDCFYCPECNNWLEDKCSVTKEDWLIDPWECMYRCWDRPDRPIKD